VRQVDVLHNPSAAAERWLREDVVPVVTAMRADPSRGVALPDAFDTIRAMHAERKSQSGRDA